MKPNHTAHDRWNYVNGPFLNGMLNRADPDHGAGQRELS